MSRWKGYFERAKELAAGADPLYARRLAYMKAMVLDRLVAGQESIAKFASVLKSAKLRENGSRPLT